MIAYLKGTIRLKTPTYLVVENTGVGYKVFSPLSTITKLKTGLEAAFHIHTHVREDQFSLYGFLTLDELVLFELLLSVSGVGPKVALAVIAGATTDNIRSAIASANPEAFTKVSGVGKKIAERIVIELKEKIGDLGQDSSARSTNFGESLDALVALGYNKQEAREALKQAPAELQDTGEIVRAALKVLGRK